jgi:hypothetical protein
VKIRILKLTPEALIRALQGKAPVASNLPDDIELLDISYDLFAKEVAAMVRSDSFEDIKENYPFPEFKLTISASPKTQVTPNAKLDLKPAEVKVSKKVTVQPQQTQDTGKLEEEFSPEQRKLLRFVVDGDYVIVKPLQFLKTEWEDINDVVKSIGGRWVKGDIINYWEIPKNQT